MYWIQIGCILDVCILQPYSCLFVVIRTGSREFENQLRLAEIKPTETAWNVKTFIVLTFRVLNFLNVIIFPGHRHNQISKQILNRFLTDS